MNHRDMSTRKLFRKLRTATKDLHFFGRVGHTFYKRNQESSARDQIKGLREELNRRGWGV